MLLKILHILRIGKSETVPRNKQEITLRENLKISISEKILNVVKQVPRFLRKV